MNNNEDVIVEERFVKYDVAKWLESNGFDCLCYWYYPKNGGEVQQLSWAELNYNLGNYIKAPTHQMAIDWIRAKYGISIELMMGAEKYTVRIVGRCLDENELSRITIYAHGDDPIEYDGPEQAIDAELEWTIKNVI